MLATLIARLCQKQENFTVGVITKVDVVGKIQLRLHLLLGPQRFQSILLLETLHWVDHAD